MLPQYDVALLIENIKRRCSVPTSQLTYTDEDFTLLANDELQGEIVPTLMSAREEYFVDFVDMQVPGTYEIEIPDYCVGEKLRSVCFVQQASPLVLTNLPRIDLDVVAGVGAPGWGAGAICGFYIQGNKLVLYPNQGATVGQTIRLYYYKRTLVLAAPSEYGRVTAVDPLNLSVTLSNVPTSWEIGTQLNSVSSLQPFGASNELMTITNLSSPTVFLDSVEGIQVGDYISGLGYSAIPQVPVEAHPYLAQLTAVKCLEGLGDREGMKAAQAKADALKVGLMTMISQRVDGSVKKIIQPSGGLRLRSGIWRRGGGWGGW